VIRKTPPRAYRALEWGDRQTGGSVVLDADARQVRTGDFVEHLVAPGKRGEVLELVSRTEVRVRWFGVDWDVTDADQLRIVTAGGVA
jgi:hypothetical protein